MRIKRAHGCVDMEFLRGGGTYLHSIVVDPEWQNTGYGSRLLEKALEKARLPVYLLACDELGGNTDRLVKWYKRFGFTRKRGCDVGYNYNMVRWE